jgi:GNAT superfamily N-acetyltransferase
MTLEIRRAKPDDADAVADMVGRLLTELNKGETVQVSTTVAADLLTRPDDFAAYLAVDGGKVVGAMTLSTCYALYADGAFCEIAELYVSPEWRSRQAGKLLVEAAADHCRSRGWTTLEVGAPPADAWSRTVAFYKRNGFEDIGPRLNLILKPDA